MIVNSSERVGSRYERGLNRAHTRIHAASGLWPVILSPYGGDRTDSEQFHLMAIGKTNVPPWLTDHSVRKNGGRAEDMNNWQAIEARIGRTRLHAIMAAEGWYNQTINGEPFPAEGWHYACHKSLAWLLARTAKVTLSGVVAGVLPNARLDESMDLFLSTNEVAPYLSTDLPSNGKKRDRWYTWDAVQKALKTVPVGKEDSMKLLYGKSKKVTANTLDVLLAQSVAPAGVRL